MCLLLLLLLVGCRSTGGGDGTSPDPVPSASPEEGESAVEGPDPERGDPDRAGPDASDESGSGLEVSDPDRRDEAAGPDEQGTASDESGDEATPEDETVGIGMDGREIAVEGLEVRDMSCEFGEGAGGFAMLELVAVLSERKASLDACAPDGGAFRVQFDWSAGSDVGTDVLGGRPSSATQCAGRALAGSLDMPFEGVCTAYVFAGELEGARAAYRALKEGN